MSSGTEAADQVVSMSLRGIEVMAKISGEGAKHLAVYLFTALQGQKRTRGRIRLESLLRSGKELKVFAVRNEDLPTFCKEAKRYGVLYCALRDKKNVDGLCDVMVRAEDASKINRIVERFKLATIDTANIKQEIVKSRSEHQPDERKEAVPELEQALTTPEGGISEPPSTNEGAVSEDFLDELLGKPDPAAEVQPANAHQETDLPVVGEQVAERTEPEHPLPLPPTQEERITEPLSPSAPTSERGAAYVKGAIDSGNPVEKVSVRQLLREIRELNRAAETKRREQEQKPSLPKRRDRTKAASSSKKVSVPTTRKRGKSK